MASFNLKRVLTNNKQKKNNNNERDDFGRFKPGGGGCKKHPKHHQSPGVCSLCLNDRLLQLSSSSSASVIGGGSSCSSSVSSLSSYYSSSSASSCASPVSRHFPLTSEGKRSSTLSIFLLSGAKHNNNNGLLKSRSMAVDHDYHRRSKKKSGFWSKFLPSKSKRINTMEEKEANKVVVLRSSSMRETTVTVDTS
ncbi:uncharacterized protein LOC130943959 [Arachis stenosperma]|uniref:uncharacterized protein LOC130943959 n=1 Tax=Arachis stenosperma TaxID=217475 RepID=UPI0025AD617F|nr:uncharacterized protein LOC130943959 [Arachis stenosperma]